MASYKYTYPRVDITTTALSRPVLNENVPDTLVLFAPFKADLGPVNQFVICHTRAEFETTFGTIDYAIQGQNGLNILHWLNNGGTVYAVRVSTVSDDGSDTGNDPASAYMTINITESTESGDGEPTTTTIRKYLTFTTKNPGDGYDSFKIQLSKYTNTSFIATVYFGSVQMERFIITPDSYEELLYKENTISEYVYINTSSINQASKTDIFDYTDSKVTGFKPAFEDAIKTPTTLSFSGGKTEGTTQDALIKMALEYIPAVTDGDGNSVAEYEHPVRKLLKDSLQYPIDVMLDAGFTTDTKKAIWGAFNSNATDPQHIRNDVFVYYDAYEFEETSIQPVIPKDGDPFYDSVIATTDNAYRPSENSHNAAIYQQFYKVKDSYINSQIFVTPSYFISTMLPYQTITLNKGYHTPIAGLTNGEMSGVLYVNQNPTPNEKDTWFTARVNYSEKDSRQISFMSQRTLESADKNTALQFINNSLMTNIIVKELGILAREYLFEYNDAITLSNIRKTLNTYISNYVASRVLEYAVIDVQKNEFSPEAIDVAINIKYTGTIEVISIDLTIE